MSSLLSNEKPLASDAQGVGLQQKLFRSHFYVAWLGLVSLILILLTVISLSFHTQHLTKVSGPTLRGTLKMNNGLQVSLASLRGWIVLGQPAFKMERAKSWNGVIHPALKQLDALSAHWSNESHSSKLSQLKQKLKSLQNSQWWIEDSAQSPGNEPGRVLLDSEVVPLASTIFQAITDCINIESNLPAKGRKPLLTAMADARGFLSKSRGLLVATVDHAEQYNLKGIERSLALVKDRLHFLLSQRSLLTDDQQQLIDLIQDEFDAYESLASEVMAFVHSKRWNIARYHLAQEAVPLAEQCSLLLNELIDYNNQAVEEQAEAVSEITTSAIIGTTLLCAILVITTTMIAKRQSVQLTAPIAALSVATQKIATGEQNEDLPILSHDEIGELTDAFNSMRRTIESRTEEVAQATRELLLLENRNRATIESAPIAMVQIDAQRRIVLINTAAEKLFGYSHEELMGKTIETLLPARYRADHPQQVKNYLETPISRQMGAGRELFGLHKNGREFPVEIGLNPIVTEEGVFVLSVIVDITDRKNSEEALRESKKQAEEASRAKSEFLANMSHEIRTPMNAIIGLTDLVLESDLEHMQRDYLATVSSSAEALLQIINDILDFSKIEAGKMELTEQDFQIRDLVGDSLKSLSIKAHERDIEIAFRIAPDVPEVLLGDPSRLRQVLVNLIGNSLKFTQIGHILVEVKLADNMSSAEELVELQFSVEDTGIGIPPEKLDLVFSAFEQVDTSSARKYGGTGLGLSITNRLVQKMNGRIWVESDLGEGSTFHFLAQFKRTEKIALQSWRQISAKFRGKEVLLVDDNQVNRVIVKELLESTGMKVHEVAEGTAGMEILADTTEALANRINLVLSDVKMPGMDGYEFVRKIRELEAHRDLPIILLASAYGANEDSQLDQLGVSARLMKPVKQADLFEAIALALGLTAEIQPKNVVLQGTDVVASGEYKACGRRLRILLAEDSLPNQKLALALLDRDGHETTIVNNGRAAVDAVSSQDFDIVLMDVQMPEMDGFEATINIREGEQQTGKHLPIVAMTAHALMGDRERCLELGMDDYVSKPIRRETLNQAIERALYSSTASQVSTADVVGSRQEAAPVDISVESAGGVEIPWNELLEGIGNDRATLLDIALAYLAEIQEVSQHIPVAIQADDNALVRRLAHKLKSGFKFFKQTEIAEKAQKLELLAESEKSLKVGLQYELLSQDIEPLSLQIATYCNEPSNEAPSPA